MTPEWMRRSNDEMRWVFAIIHYKRFGDLSHVRKLQAEGIKSKRGRKFLQDLEDGTIKRPKGPPPKLQLTDEQVVTRVYKAYYCLGKAFTNHPTGDTNPCFVAVADAHGVNVSTIRRRFYAMPADQRHKVKDGVHQFALDAGLLHPSRKG
jgi:hypothetical protein